MVQLRDILLESVFDRVTNYEYFVELYTFSTSILWILNLWGKGNELKEKICFVYCMYECSWFVVSSAIVETELSLVCRTDSVMEMMLRPLPKNILSASIHLHYKGLGFRFKKKKKNLMAFSLVSFLGIFP